MTDGPYVEAKEIMASFVVIQADSYDSALVIARESPGVTDPASGWGIEIREMAGYA